MLAVTEHLGNLSHCTVDEVAHQVERLLTEAETVTLTYFGEDFTFQQRQSVTEITFKLTRASDRDISAPTR